MIKRIYGILFACLLLIGCPWEPDNGGDGNGDNEMAKDWALSSEGATLEMSYTGTGSASNTANVNDGNDTTYSVAGPASNGGGSITYDITFVGPRYLAEIKFRVWCIGYGSVGKGNITFSYYDGSWHELGTVSPGSATTYTYSAGYINVTKIRVYGSVFRLDGSSYSEYRTYTMSATDGYNDSGLRIRKSGLTVSIACNPLSASDKLRFRKGATTVGIQLVPTTDSYASPLRVYDGNAIKALMKYIP